MMREGTYFVLRSPEALLAAVDVARTLGFQRLDAHSPYAMAELDAKLGPPRRLPAAAIVAGLLGCALAYVILRLCGVDDFPLVVRGHPVDSLPADVPIVFETTVLLAGVASFLAVTLFAGVPRSRASLPSVADDDRASVDGFWLAVEDDYDGDEVLRARLVALGASVTRRDSAAP